VSPSITRTILPLRIVPRQSLRLRPLGNSDREETRQGDNENNAQASQRFHSTGSPGAISSRLPSPCQSRQRARIRRAIPAQSALPSALGSASRSATICRYSSTARPGSKLSICCIVTTCPSPYWPRWEIRCEGSLPDGTEYSTLRLAPTPWRSSSSKMVKAAAKAPRVDPRP
jgi:hypothetical protein